ncbi:DinB family protein [Planococcus sp. CPCC 101016]|uniref:DinB family protein n=1 Tax=Planococcus sp. CPCC 101016 TaxID=2599617 RepID=UPI0011B7100B|nr:DinB family protein [Planococcus sp. CPCC 101016]TWT07957.1 DinB family protein [Planococcus sp. CPCC 101016]
MRGKEVLFIFKNELSKYSSQQLQHIPKEGVWSIGQMYDHIILVAHEYLDNVEICAASNEKQPLGKTLAGKKLFKDGGFPPIKIRLPDEMNASPNNSDDREKLAKRVEEVIKRLEHWEREVASINPNYKVEHGGFGWLNAKEWVDLVEMHSRHHLRQKEALESYLEKEM